MRLGMCLYYWALSALAPLPEQSRRSVLSAECRQSNAWLSQPAQDTRGPLSHLYQGVVVSHNHTRELRNSLDTVKIETERQSGFHMSVATQIRTDLEAPTAAFNARQVQHKKSSQNAIEKEFKNKQIQESYVNKAREKYEQDCLRINSFTAQASLVQGKDLEKINLKLERTQQTVQTNEREFANYSKALHDTVQKWEQDWKGFCDSCQDMEESRLEFMKDNMWHYANTISTACVSDDEVRTLFLYRRHAF